MSDPWETYSPASSKVSKDPWDDYNPAAQSGTPPHEEITTPLKMGRDRMADDLRETLRGTDWATRNIAGAGTALSDIYQGAKQMIGLGDEQAIELNKVISEEAPVGSFAGNVALTALPFGMVGNSVKGAAAVGAGFGALQPVSGEQTAGNILKGKVINTGLGAATAAGGQVLANKASGYVSKKLSALATQRSQNAPLDATIKEALDANYVIPPGQVKPTFMNKRLESAAGKIATQQEASTRNQVITDSLARRAAGLGVDEPITPQSLQAARDVIKKPYQDIAELGLSGPLDALDAARNEANAAWREYSRQGTRAALNDYKAFKAEAANIESSIEKALIKSNKPQLMRAFRDARVALAKNHDVETALIEGGGSVDARSIARMFQRGDKLTDELKTIGSFANNFPKIVQPDKAVGTPGAHNLRHVLSVLAGGGGFLGGGGIPGALAGAAAVEAAPLAAQSIMFSKPMQQRLINNYTVGAPTRRLADLMRYAPIGGAVGSLEAFGQ